MNIDPAEYFGVKIFIENFEIFEIEIYFFYRISKKFPLQNIFRVYMYEDMTRFKAKAL